MCGVHICNMCMCVYTCEKWGIALSPNCSDLSTTHQMASAYGVNFEPTCGGCLRKRCPQEASSWAPGYVQHSSSVL